MKEKIELINKSIGAALLISLGNFALLKLGNPIGPIIFAFGLLGVCYMELNLFTGKCGFFVQDKIKIVDLLIILIVNLLAGYFFGVLYSIADAELIGTAVNKIAGWDFSFPFFIKSILCGIVMYIAVYLYKKNTSLGILLGVPLFIFCGFQHCIANIITLGVARTFDISIILCVIGNFIGSISMWFLARDMKH